MTKTQHLARLVAEGNRIGKRRRACRFAMLALVSALPLGATARAQPRPAVDPATQRWLAAGDSAWTRAARDSAYSAYQAAVALDSAAAPYVLLRMARCDVERDRRQPALALLRLYLRHEPADDQGHILLARVLASERQYDAAIQQYDAVLGRDSTHREATLGRAQSLAWSGRFAKSVAVYRHWLDGAPNDSSARLGLAQALSWAGRWDEAAAQFGGLAQGGTWPEAEKGLARLAGWRGELSRSEALWRSLVARFPVDAEAWIGLAQVQRWLGHPVAADSALRRALALAPGSADARTQWEWLQVELAETGEPAIARFSDSEGNRSTQYAITLTTRPLGAVRYDVTASHRAAQFVTTQAQSTGAKATLAWSSPGRRMNARVAIGASRLSSHRGAETSAASVYPTAFVRVAGRLASRVTAGVALSRAPFDETATLIAGRILTSAIDANLSVAAPRRIALDLGASRAHLSGGRVPNDGLTLLASARWTARRGFDLLLTARQLGYDTTGRADGYFAPHRFSVLEIGARHRFGGDRGWGATFDGGVGSQLIRITTAEPTQRSVSTRGSLEVRYAPAPGYSLEASYAISTAATSVVQDVAGYSARLFGLRARLPLATR